MEKILKDLLSESSQQSIEDEILSFDNYLNLVTQEPWITRDTSQLLHDMMLTSGVEHQMIPGKPVKHTYKFFDDPHHLQH